MAAMTAAAVLGGCGGGGGDDGASAPPTVSATAAETPRYSQPVLLTISGSNLDRGITLSSNGCSGITLQTSAPTVSSATTAYYRCNVTAVGNVQVSITRSSDNTSLAGLGLVVPVPQVTMSLSNGAGVNGSIVITLTPTQAPITVDNFLAYVKAGFYTGTVFHRNSPNFVLQGGGYAGPLVAGGSLPTVKTPIAGNIVLEDNAGLSNLRLTVAMARTSAVDSANSQFFINLVDNTFLDRSASARGYAVFGNVTGGDSVVTAMTAAPCTAWSGFLGAGECLPSPNITVTSATQTR